MLPCEWPEIVNGLLPALAYMASICFTTCSDCPEGVVWVDQWPLGLLVPMALDSHRDLRICERVIWHIHVAGKEALRT